MTFLSQHPAFAKGAEPTPLERQIIEQEGRVCYNRYCMRLDPKDPDYEIWYAESLQKLEELNHQWRKENHRLWEEEEGAQPLEL